MIGALSAKYLFDLLRIDSPAIRGFALGTASHGIGAARAMQVHPDAGAYAGLALGIQVIVASLFLPLIARLFQGDASGGYRLRSHLAHDQMSILVHGGTLTRKDPSGGIELLNNSGAVE